MNYEQPLRIHKYGNRRLYRTDLSRYVVLTELAQMVREGVDFVVVDAKTGSDITAVVLAQIILDEQRKGGVGTPPVELLKTVLRSRDARVGLFLERSLPTLIDRYLTGIESAEEELEQVVVEFE